MWIVTPSPKSLLKLTDIRLRFIRYNPAFFSFHKLLLYYDSKSCTKNIYNYDYNTLPWRYFPSAHILDQVPE